MEQPRVGSMTDLTSTDTKVSPEVLQVRNLMKMGLTPDYIIDERELTPIREIGRGTFGATYLAQWGNTKVAVKVENCTKEGKGVEEMFKSFSREIAALTKASHPNICKFLGCTINPPMYGIVLEYMDGGSLFDLFGSYKPVDFFPLALGVARGMNYIHSDLLMNHRDLKSPNLLLDGTGKTVKIVDFGLSCMNEKEGDKTGEVGTYRWMAPEVILHQAYGYSADVYGYGCVLLEMVTRTIPFAGTEPMQVARKVLKGERPKLPDETPKQIKKLIEKCWDQNPEKRPTFSEIVDQLEIAQKTLTPKECETLRQLGTRKPIKSPQPSCSSTAEFAKPFVKLMKTLNR